MLTVIIGDPRGMPLVRELLLAHTYWHMRGFRADLTHFESGRPQLRAASAPPVAAPHRCLFANRPAAAAGTVFLRDWHAIPEEHRDLLLAASAAVLSGSRGSLQQQLRQPAKGSRAAPVRSHRQAPPKNRPCLCRFSNCPTSTDWEDSPTTAANTQFTCSPKDKTPAPWANVMANAHFGALVSESGLGCTWRGNSQTNRLTPWHNDPVTDPQSEVIYLRDDESGACWTPTPQTIRENDAYRARHGQGYTVFEHNSHAIGQELTVFVPLERRRHRRSRQSVPPAPAQRFVPSPPPDSSLFRGVGLGDQSRRSAPAHPNDLRSGIRSPLRPPVLERQPNESNRLCRRPVPARILVFRRPAADPGTQPFHLQSRRIGTRPPGQPHRRRPRSRRRPAARSLARTRRADRSCFPARRSRPPSKKPAPSSAATRLPNKSTRRSPPPENPGTPLSARCKCTLPSSRRISC